MITKGKKAVLQDKKERKVVPERLQALSVHGKRGFGAHLLHFCLFSCESCSALLPWGYEVAWTEGFPTPSYPRKEGKRCLLFTNAKFAGVKTLPQWPSETRNHLIVASCGARCSNVLKRENRPYTTKRTCSGKIRYLLLINLIAKRGYGRTRILFRPGSGGEVNVNGAEERGRSPNE